jgi:hypothetical protein
MKSQKRAWAGVQRVLTQLLGRTKHLRGRRQTCASVEVLESRQLLAASAPGWENVSRLSLSFAPDGTSAAGQTSSTFSKLSALGSTSVWQQTILDAFQTWAAHSRINVGVVNDSGVAAGVPGDLQQDTRFGDIRVVTIGLSSDVAALSVMRNETQAGTWFGDLVINSNYNITNVDSLYNLALHEAGHIFGLESSTDPASPMYSTLQTSGRKSPTTQDVSDLQLVNGVRTADAYDSVTPNETLASATLLTTTGDAGWNGGEAPIIAWAELQSSSDVDYFRINAAPDYTGTVSFRLQTTGLSQLRGRIQVYNGAGQLLGSASTTNSNTDLRVAVSGSTGSETFYVKVSTLNNTAASEGSYAVVATCDGKAKASTTFIQNVIATTGQDLDPISLAKLLRFGENYNESKEFDFESGRNVVQVPTLPSTSKFFNLGSISTANDIDMYKFRVAADGQRLTATVRSIDSSALLPALALVDKQGNEYPVTVLANGMGQYTIQSAGLQSNRSYYLRVDGLTDSALYGVGRYKVTMRLGTEVVNHKDYASGTLTTSAPSQFFKFELQTAQMFQWAVQVDPGSAAGQATVEVALFDAAGNMKYRLIGLPGQLRTADALLLGKGTYYVRIALTPIGNANPVPITYKLKGSLISDPISVVGNDPSGSAGGTTLTNGQTDPTYESVLWYSTPIYSTGSSTSVDINTIYDTTWNSGYLV